MWPAANTRSHIFGSNMSTGGDSIDHRCACLGNNRAYCTGVCVFGDMSKVEVIEQVNTIWEQRHWTKTKAVHLLQRKNSPLLATTQPVCSQIHHPALYNPFSHLRLHPPAALQLPDRLNTRTAAKRGGEDALPPLLLSWSGEGLEGFLGFN